jgi:DNA-binding transcriptional regulator YhcF (GntR family)
MKIVLSRKSPVPIRHQLGKQLELRILSGDLRAGAKLPAVRVLARTLGIHANTVAAAYRDLQRTGRVTLRPGVGVFVRRLRRPVSSADGVDAAVRDALRELASGFGAGPVRSAVERWFRAQPGRVAIVDPHLDSAELLAHEVATQLGQTVEALTFDRLDRDALLGALAVVVPYHAERFTTMAPHVPVEVVHIQIAQEHSDAVRALPKDALVLVVSHAGYVLEFSKALFHSLRGDEILIEGRLIAAAKEWQRLARLADLTFVDALAALAARRHGIRNAREFRLLSNETLERIQAAVSPG